eukprot:SAG31_NODE_1788_length_7267_cov_6.640067_7_plen_106_part_00
MDACRAEQRERLSTMGGEDKGKQQQSEGGKSGNGATVFTWLTFVRSYKNSPRLSQVLAKCNTLLSDPIRQLTLYISVTIKRTPKSVRTASPTTVSLTRVTASLNN